MKKISVLVVLLAAVAGSVLAQPPIVHIDNGLSEHLWDRKANAGTMPIAFVFFPERGLADTEYLILGECFRTQNGIPRGKHKVTFRNLSLLGVDSGNALTGVNQSAKIKNGIQQELVTWDLTPLAGEFVDDSAVLITVDVQVKKRVAAFDELSCIVGAAEFLDPDVLRVGEDDPRAKVLDRMGAPGALYPAD